MAAAVLMVGGAGPALSAQKRKQKSGRRNECVGTPMIKGGKLAKRLKLGKLLWRP